MSASELKRCPFCGREVHKLEMDTARGGKIRLIECIECGTRGPVKYNFDEAIAAWNRRAGERKNIRLKRALLAAIRERCHSCFECEIWDGSYKCNYNGKCHVQKWRNALGVSIRLRKGATNG